MLRPVLIILALIWVPFVLIWAVDLDVVWQIPSALAFLGYVAAATLVVLILALLLKARVAAVLAAIGLVVLVAPRADRVRADEQPAARGPKLVVATSNAYVGSGEPDVLVDLVRREHVDVLAVQEDTPGFTADLAAEGLGRMLPYSVLSSQEGASGVSIYSRYPLRDEVRSTYRRRSTGALVDVPGSAMTLQVRSVHPPPPFNSGGLPSWKRATRGLPVARSGSTATILAGDFNATLDHHPFRDLLASGYRDAAEQTGDGWRPTWRRHGWQRLTIDHVLVPSGVAVEGVAIHDLPLSDHDVVISQLRLPR